VASSITRNQVGRGSLALADQKAGTQKNSLLFLEKTAAYFFPFRPLCDCLPFLYFDFSLRPIVRPLEIKRTIVTDWPLSLASRRHKKSKECDRIVNSNSVY
jgi:hypothetical protein